MALESEKISLWLGMALLLVSSLVLIAFSHWLVIAAFAAGVLLLMWALYRYTGCNAGDERVRKIVVYAITNSWLAMFFFVAMYIVFDMMGLLSLTRMGVLALTMFTMVLFFGVWFVYFWRKGDVE